MGNGRDVVMTGAVIRRADHLSPRELSELAELLVACVDDGASLGFLAPLDPRKAREWRTKAATGDVVLFIAEVEGRIVGTVQLQPVDSENGAHRGDVSKLLVHPAWRRRWIARALMTRLETEASDGGKTLLVLDTREGDPSNDLYRTLGYCEAGRIPDWARDAADNFSVTVFWYKVLECQGERVSG
jgi:ribosomal protein S18 acetylase RimI-like enzyme